MNALARPSSGNHVFARPQARPAYYPAGVVSPVQVEVWWRYQGEPARAARLLGVFTTGQAITLPYNPGIDRNLIISTIGISATGIRSVNSLVDALEQVVVFQRLTAAPTVSQVGASTHTKITLAVDDVPGYATNRQVRSADDSAMTINVVTQITVAPFGQPLPRLVDLTRADAGTGTRTVYVRISHSSGGAYSAESAAQAFTYADSGGAGGGSGSTDSFYRRGYTV